MIMFFGSSFLSKALIFLLNGVLFSLDLSQNQKAEKLFELSFLLWFPIL